MIEREGEARQVAEEWSTWPEVEVAVVVYVKARGADREDAHDRAVDGVRRCIGQERTLPVVHRGLLVEGAGMTVVRVEDLGRAAARGRIQMSVSRSVFR